MSPFVKLLFARPALPGLRRVASRFGHDRRGSIGMILGLGAIPAFGLLAMAIDYGVALQAKAKLDIAADAASMVAINTARDYIQNSATSGSAVVSAAISSGQTQARLAFAANAGAIGYTTIPTPTVTMVQDPVNPRKLTATVSYQTTTTTNLTNIMGFTQIALRGSSTSTLTSPTYINYYIITDSSQSMGVAATPTDMQNLYDRVIANNNYDSTANKSAGVGCVFGCHVQQTSGGLTQIDTNENLAHLPKYGSPIKLRIDSARDAILAILQDAADANSQSGLNLVQVGIYMMQRDPQVSPTTYIKNVVAPPNYNFTATTTAINDTTKFDLGNNNGGGTGDSDFVNSISTFANTLPYQGDGSTQAKALNYVFIITDGIFDTPGGGCTYGHCTGAFDDSQCTQLKSKATVGVIYTTYNPVYYKNNSANGFVDTYRDLVAPSIGSVPGNLQACSSDRNAYYFEAQDGPGITTGMKKLFAPTIQAAMLSR